MAGRAAPALVNSTKHLLGLINEVLDLSKIEAGKLELNLEPVNLARLIWDDAHHTTSTGWTGVNIPEG
jgi:signal transduction histidine kinase